ncbi:MAG: AarF/UbiB family protein, partial [Myxococcota bacterium]
VEMSALMKELETRFLDECDYRKEADYQTAYGERFAGHPYIVVPEVHRGWSTQRVLTTTYYEGKSFHEWLKSEPSEDDRQRVTQLFYRFYLGSLYLDGLFNCDPHPGNYLFLDDGRVVFLDYGCCRRFTQERLEQWIAMNKAVCDDDPARLHEVAVDVGFFAPGAKYDREAFRTLMRYLYQPYLKDEPFDFSGEHRPETTFRAMFSQNPNLFKLNMPADAVFLNRIEFGLVSMLAKIGGKLNCHQYATSYFQGIDPDWAEDPKRPRPPADVDGGA